MLKVFIGYDSREDIAYQVCRESLARNSSIWLDIKPIKIQDMRERNLYWRENDPLSSTEFSFTRFLTPYLAGYDGWALFCDCDFLFRRDIAGLLGYADRTKACVLVKHDYRPAETVKMDNKPQHLYYRKNWSSFMLFNCGHEAIRELTPDVVNESTGMYLHQFEWIAHFPMTTTCHKTPNFSKSMHQRTTNCYVIKSLCQWNFIPFEPINYYRYRDYE